MYDYWDIRAQDERDAIQYALNIQQKDTVRRMLAEGLDIALIVKCTGPSADEISALTGETAEKDTPE